MPLHAPVLRHGLALTCQTPSGARFEPCCICSALRSRGFCLISAFFVFCTKTDVTFGSTVLVATSSEPPKTWPVCSISDFLKACLLMSCALRFLRFFVGAIFRHVLCCCSGRGGGRGNDVLFHGQPGAS